MANIQCKSYPITHLSWFVLNTNGIKIGTIVIGYSYRYMVIALVLSTCVYLSILVIVKHAFKAKFLWQKNCKQKHDSFILPASQLCTDPLQGKSQ